MSERVCVVHIIIAYRKAVDSSITVTDIPAATETHRLMLELSNSYQKL